MKHRAGQPADRVPLAGDRLNVGRTRHATMSPSRRDLLRAAGLAATGSLAGCVDGIVPGGGGGPPPYLGWLARPGRLVDPQEYRVGVLRPAATADAATRFAPFLPTLSVPPVDPAASERVIVGGGATVLTTDVEQSSIIDAYRDEGYRYERGIEEFWILEDGDGETPTVAVGPDTLVVATATATESAPGVVDTLLYGRQSDDRWTAAEPALEAFATRLGEPPALVLDLAPSTTMAPRRGQFARLRARAIIHRFDPPERTYALLFEAGDATPPAAVRTWAETALTDLQDASIETDGAVVTVTGQPTNPEWIETTLPAADRIWSGIGADPRRRATLPAGRATRTPVRERWTFLPEGVDSPPGTDLQGPQSPRQDRDSALPFASPTIGNEQVYTTADDCYAIDRRDGSLRWQAGLDGAAGTPVLAGERVYTIGAVDGAAAVVALDAATGETAWVWHPPTGPISTIATDGDRLFVGTTSPYLAGGETQPTDTDLAPVGVFAVSDGTEVWRSTETPGAALAVADDTLVASGGGTTARVSGLDVDTGRQRWERDVTGLTFPTVAVGGNRVVVAGEGSVAGLGLGDGRERWRVTPASETTFTRAAVTDEVAYVGDGRPPRLIRPEEDGGRLRAIDLEDGTERHKTGFTRRVTARPALVGDALYVVAGGGALMRFTTDLERTWTLYTAGRLGPPAVAGGTVYLPTAMGPLAAFGTDWLPGPTTRLIRARR